MRNVTTTARVIRGMSVLATLVLLGACGIPFKRSQRHPYPSKQVTAKEGVSVLVAGTSRCLVPTKQFAKINVGQQHECNWREGGPAVQPAH